ncbi:hypothetical protein AHX51_14860 [Salmonella enterica subsp. diarizonae]|nr:hypothetical protein [Salmonella enterica subsp. diarizonae]
MSVFIGWRSSGSLAFGPRDYVKISRNRVGLLREKLRNCPVIMVSGYQILIPGHHNLVPALIMYSLLRNYCYLFTVKNILNNLNPSIVTA